MAKNEATPVADKNGVILEILKEYAAKHPQVKTGDGGEKWMEIIQAHPKWSGNFGNDRPAGPSIGKMKEAAGIFVADKENKGSKGKGATLTLVPVEVDVTAADMRNAWTFVKTHFNGDFDKAKKLIDEIPNLEIMKKAFEEIQEYENLKAGKKTGTNG